MLRERPSFTLALIELPYAVKISETIQPVRLPPNCDPIGELVDVQAIGNGRTYEHQPAKEKDGIVREASFKTLSCQTDGLPDSIYYNESSVICSFAMNEQNTCKGDSGETKDKYPSSPYSLFYPF